MDEYLCYNGFIIMNEVIMVAETTSLNIKVDRDLKTQADTLFNAMGMTLTTAVNVFIRQAVQEQAIPFKIHLDDKNRFHELLDSMRSEAAKRGFMSDEEINAEIQAARAEMKARGTQA
jgi:DNA-damage-inducible protein J